MEGAGYIDIHSHIIPEVDDGAKSFEESLAMLNVAYEQGIRTMYATPHYGSGKEKYDKQFLINQYQKLKEMAQNIGGDGIELILGNEIYYGYSTLELLEKREIFTMGDSRYVLVEFNYGIGYNELYKALQGVINAGYRPILAHIERYYCLYRNMSEIRQLRELGVALQINTDSVMAKLSSEASFCRKLIKEGYIHFFGSDCHRLNWRPPLMKSAVDTLRKKISDDILDKILYTNTYILKENSFL